jgi:hypothetical protein
MISVETMRRGKGGYQILNVQLSKANNILYFFNRPPLWSSGQSSWLQIRKPGFDSRHYEEIKK